MIEKNYIVQPLLCFGTVAISGLGLIPCSNRIRTNRCNASECWNHVRGTGRYI